MAGRGPRPKDPDKKARRNAEPTPLRVVYAEPTEQPKLPTFYVTDDDGNRHKFRWPERTKQWWKMWADSPLSDEFTETDWSELLDTALLHAKFWQGETKLGPELRLRVAKFGATPEDRARLRITFAQADEADEKRTPSAPSSRSRRGGLKALPDARASSE